MSIRKDFEEFCRRTRPPMSTARELNANGRWGEYANNSTNAAWRAWQYLEKQYNPPLTRRVGVFPEWKS